MLLLHAGCGREPLPPEFIQDGAKEVRLDIDPDARPDIVASIHDMGDIGPFDAVYCSHCLEHLLWADAEKAVDEFYRVLNPGGFAMVMVPDLTDIRPTEEVVYHVNGLAITGLDMMFGYRGYTGRNPYMRHQCGFIPETLRAMMEGAGFTRVTTRTSTWNLVAAGIKL